MEDRFYTKQEIIELGVNWFFDRKDTTTVVEQTRSMTDAEFCSMVASKYSLKIIAVRRNRYELLFK